MSGRRESPWSSTSSTSPPLIGSACFINPMSIPSSSSAIVSEVLFSAPPLPKVRLGFLFVRFWLPNTAL
jgi:hypothetical protein